MCLWSQLITFVHQVELLIWLKSAQKKGGKLSKAEKEQLQKEEDVRRQKEEGTGHFSLSFNPWRNLCHMLIVVCLCAHLYHLICVIELPFVS